MANTNNSSDPAPSLSAAELRRRLLASTPPPIAATASSPDMNEEEQVQTWANPAQELLSRLRMPGGKSSGTVSNQATSRSVSVTPVEPPPGTVNRGALNRRTPTVNARVAAHDGPSAIAGVLNQLSGIADGGSRGGIDDSPMAEMHRLRSENKELRHLLEEMKHLLQEASDAEQQFTAKESSYQAAMEQKDTQIEELSAQLGAIEEQIAKGELAPPPPAPKTRGELEEWGDELEKESAKLAQERRHVDEERRQLREDEEALETQMRNMEVSMARERALIARQETELKRLSAEIQHELDLMQRGDAGLREQMAKFQRRAQDVMVNPPGQNSSPGRR